MIWSSTRRRAGPAICTALLLMLAPATQVRASTAEAALLEGFLSVVAQMPPLDLPRETIRDGIVLPLTKTVARADGVTLGVVADNLKSATAAAVRQEFATFADRFLGMALLRLPRRAVQSPQAAGFIEYRATAGVGAVFMLAWRSDQPFAASAAPEGSDLCTRLLPPFELGAVPAAASAGLQRRQTYTRSFEGVRYQRSSSYELRTAGKGLVWAVISEECQTLN